MQCQRRIRPAHECLERGVAQRSHAPRFIYRGARTLLNAGVAWQWRPPVSIFCDVSNLTNAPQETYFATPDRMQRRIINAPTVTFGLNGRF